MSRAELRNEREKSNSNDANDEAELARMGYKQELKRGLSLLQNFGMSFSIISVITGTSSLFAYGLNTGGPTVIVWGWIVVSFFTMMVGLSMAEVCSAHPTSGGPYFWAAKIVPAKRAPFASWAITGWFNFIGQFAVTTGISFAAAQFLSTAVALGTSFTPTPGTTIGIYAGVLVTQGLINTFGVGILGIMNTVSIWWHALGTCSVVIAALAKATTHQSGKFVFTHFVDNTGDPGWGIRVSNAYVAIIGILLAQYTMTGFDASAHMTEETHNAATSGSWGIVISIGVSAILGWFLVVGLLFSIQDYERTISSPTGQPVAQILIDTVGQKGATALIVVIFVCMYFAGTFSITSNSRMMYAFSRDGALPGSKFFHHVDPTTKTPVRTVWLAVILSFILGLPSLGSQVAFSAATSIATIGLYISYGIPVALRVIYHKNFKKGPFHLGKFSFPICITASLWIMFISIVFILPQVDPVSSQTLNYSIVAVGVVMTYSLAFWLLSARNWFTGPIQQIKAEHSGFEAVDDVNVLDKSSKI